MASGISTGHRSCAWNSPLWQRIELLQFSFWVFITVIGLYAFSLSGKAWGETLTNIQGVSLPQFISPKVPTHHENFVINTTFSYLWRASTSPQLKWITLRQACHSIYFKLRLWQGLNVDSEDSSLLDFTTNLYIPSKDLEVWNMSWWQLTIKCTSSVLFEYLMQYWLSIGKA